MGVSRKYLALAPKPTDVARVMALLTGWCDAPGSGKY